MPLIDHLGEFRRRFTIVIVALIICAVVVYFATPELINILMEPIQDVLGGNSLTVLTALGGFSIRFKVAFFFAVIICSPIIIWEVLAFFLPALKPNEQKWVVPTLGAMVLLFFFGMIFCYFIIQPAAFGWLVDQTNAFAEQLNNAEDFLNIFMLLEIGFGLAFQLPLVIFYLSILHLVPYRVFRQQWRYVYVGLMVLSAIVTPDASPVTMVLMFAALIGLYEIALAVARVIIVAKDGKAALKWSREDYARHAEEKEMVKSAK